MALARIITRSQACSRELALDLLARGYAVEIVSPDQIPDNLADLELRVDAGPGDQLVASVAAHDGGRSASMEFVHHLKAPMGDFIRRPLEPGEVVHFTGELVNFNAEPGSGDVEQIAEAPQPSPKAVSAAAKILRDPEPDLKASPLNSPPDRLPSLPIKPASQPVIASTVIPPPTTVAAGWKAQRRDWRGGGFWPAVLTLASIMLLALALWFGVRPAGKASAHISGAAPTERVAVDTGKNFATNPGRDSGQLAAVPPPSPVSKPATAGTSAADTGSRLSPRHGDDFVARDTVTYLDKRTAEAATAARAKLGKPAVGRRPNSSKPRGGVIAANSVTYFDNKPTPKAAKQGPAIKPGSNPN